MPLEPMNQLQVDLADMKAFGGKPYPFMLVAIDALTKNVAAEPLDVLRAPPQNLPSPGRAGQRAPTTASSSRGSSRS